MATKTRRAILDFIEWLRQQDIHTVEDTDGPAWSSTYVGGPDYTDEELYELYLNETGA